MNIPTSAVIMRLCSLHVSSMQHSALFRFGFVSERNEQTAPNEIHMRKAQATKIKTE